MKLKKILKQIKARLPERLPQTEAAVDAFVAEVCEVGGFPSNDSMKQAVCTQLMHVHQEASWVRKSTFIQAIRRAILNQCAYNLIQDIKQRAINEAKKAAEEQQQQVVS